MSSSCDDTNNSNFKETTYFSIYRLDQYYLNTSKWFKRNPAVFCSQRVFLLLLNSIFTKIRIYYIASTINSKPTSAR